MKLDTQEFYRLKIGAFELLLVLALVELLLGSAPRVVTFLVLAALVYIARRHFGGDFSLAQLKGLIIQPDTDQEKKQ